VAAFAVDCAAGAAGAPVLGAVSRAGGDELQADSATTDAASRTMVSGVFIGVSLRIGSGNGMADERKRHPVGQR
jgi:hypothetical protein